MNSKEKLIKLIDANNTYISQLREQVKEYCQDTSINLDDRWELFCYSDLGYEESWYVDLDTVDVYSILDINRYETVNFEFLADLVDENLYDAFREEVLKLFIKSFTYDW